MICDKKRAGRQSGEMVPAPIRDIYRIAYPQIKTMGDLKR